MNAEVVLAALSDDRWRWIEQGRIDGERRDIADSLRRSKKKRLLTKYRKSAILQSQDQKRILVLSILNLHVHSYST